MIEDAKKLDEVVVTALGIKREQKSLSYNVQQVKGDMLTTNKDANFVNSLAGKVVGCKHQRLIIGYRWYIKGSDAWYQINYAVVQRSLCC